jgi:hypothetical protein
MSNWSNSRKVARDSLVWRRGKIMLVAAVSALALAAAFSSPAQAGWWTPGVDKVVKAAGLSHRLTKCVTGPSLNRLFGQYSGRSEVLGLHDPRTGETWLHATWVCEVLDTHMRTGRLSNWTVDAL